MRFKGDFLGWGGFFFVAFATSATTIELTAAEAWSNGLVRIPHLLTQDEPRYTKHGLIWDTKLCGGNCGSGGLTI